MGERVDTDLCSVECRGGGRDGRSVSAHTNHEDGGADGAERARRCVGVSRGSNAEGLRARRANTSVKPVSALTTLMAVDDQHRWVEHAHHFGRSNQHVHLIDRECINLPLELLTSVPACESNLLIYGGVRVPDTTSHASTAASQLRFDGDLPGRWARPTAAADVGRRLETPQCVACGTQRSCADNDALLCGACCVTRDCCGVTRHHRLVTRLKLVRAAMFCRAEFL